MKKINSFSNYDLNDYEREIFKRRLISENIYRGKILAIVVIVFETILAINDIITFLFRIDNRFHFIEYLIMYVSMILINIIYLFYINQYKKRDIQSLSNYDLKKLRTYILVYVTFIMAWGSFISLLDQKLYGNLTAFMVNMITCSILYILDNKDILFPYIISILILLIGLPFFQNSKDILIGHYINLIIFVIISWIASRIIYRGYCRNYKSQILLNESKAMLEKEIAENKEINVRLSLANLQLKELALIDELTGIPNRRSFRNYIDRIFKNNVNHSSLSIILVDIDYFKQYNDHYGHDAGDKILISVANQINSIISNSSEFACRWGGEEFIFAVVNANEEGTQEIAQKIKDKVYALNLQAPLYADHCLSVSIGTSTMNIENKEEARKCIELADKALYLAKNSGRNCIKSKNDL